MARVIPAATSDAVATRLRANRGRDTRPELAIRSHLHRAGLRFRKNVRLEVAGRRTTVDVLFPGARVAVFVDGCFWHSCPAHGTQPSKNAGYWTPKLQRNVQRDREVSDLLRADGWAVLRVWEHESPGDVVRRVTDLLGRR